MLVFQLSQGCLNILLDVCLRFTHDGEGGVTSHGRFRVSSILTVGGRQVNGQAAVIAEAIEAVMLSFLLGELAIHPDTRVDATSCRCI